mmetsp:Transcript_11833/g.19932  ORF Transcript_11833/g.19932 Transcript_11833/m.19932 type:complete len:340 (+) Transcript_11833:66-1085(+)
MSKSFPTIFLDIDGVICCNMNGVLEEQKLTQLKRIVDATGAKVVLSTDWRRQAPLKKQLHQVLGRLGIDCIGATPMRAMFQPVRPQEITAWLNKSNRVSTWVAIDDRDLLREVGGAGLQGHFVKTFPTTGLTATLADRAISILQREQPPSSSIRSDDSESMPDLLSSSCSVSSTAADNCSNPINTLASTMPPQHSNPWSLNDSQSRRPANQLSSTAYGCALSSSQAGSLVGTVTGRSTPTRLTQRPLNGAMATGVASERFGSSSIELERGTSCSNGLPARRLVTANAVSPKYMINTGSPARTSPPKQSFVSAGPSAGPSSAGRWQVAAGVPSSSPNRRR